VVRGRESLQIDGARTDQHLRTPSVAFYGGERREEVELLRRPHAVVKNTILMVGWQRNVAFLSYDLILALVPVVVLAPSYFAGKVEFGQITQASVAFLTLRSALSIIVDQFNSLSNFAAVVERLGGHLGFHDVLLELLGNGEWRIRWPEASRLTAG
jgi:ABC-type uncharacterized transport system fused permease/ATPase subunit